MGRPATGSLRWNATAKTWECRVTLADGTRSRPIPLPTLPPCTVARDAPPRDCTCVACKAAEDAAARVSRKMRDGAAVDAATSETVNEWFERYYRWREKRGKGAESVGDSRGRFKKWISPKLGSRAMTSVTRDVLEEFVAYLDGEVGAESIAWKSALNIWGEVTAAFNVAAKGKDKTIRVLDGNPAADVAGPDKGLSKIKPFLRPEEIVTLLACEAVPLERRQVYAVAIYTAMRQGEIRALRVGDVDLDAMQITVSKTRKGKVEKARTKTGRARPVNVEPNLVPLLRVLADGRKPTETMLSVRAHNRCASNLRADLVLAGVTRPALHVETDMAAHLTFHNLRDTCLTHMAVRRDPPQDVQWRAGHTTSEMTEKYIAEARYQAGANFGEPLPPLPPGVVRPPPSEGASEYRSDSGGSGRKHPGLPGKTVEAPGIEPGSEKLEPLASTCVSGRLELAPRIEDQRPILGASSLFGLAARPEARRLASLFGHALREVQANLSVGRLHRFLGGESDCVVVRN